MKIFKNKTELLKEISNIKDIAFVPTMGSIHRGHLSLIKKAKKKSKNILVTIYINPKQFSKSLDFQKYPRNINKDIATLKKINIKYLYLPTYKDLYSFKPKSKIFIDKFSKNLCGKFKPGHFRGVINVINRFVEIINPFTIYLGFKDFQQLTLIESHLKKNKIATNVVACPTIRERNGIAMSSRNAKLNKNQVKIAEKVFKYLKLNKKIILSSNTKDNELKIMSNIIKIGATKVDYLKCINLKTLKKTKTIQEKSNIFIAYYLGGVRLIDNL